MCLPVLHGDTISPWGQERSGIKLCPALDTGMQLPIPFLSGGMLADMDMPTDRYLLPWARLGKRHFQINKDCVPRGGESRAGQEEATQVKR